MRKTLLLLGLAALALPTAASAQTALVITGIFDGPLTGGTPKVLELRAAANIPDLSIYDIQNYNNGSTTPGGTFALSGTATAGQYLYVVDGNASSPANFQTYFGFASNFQSGVLNVNGDDAVALRQNGTIVDVFGEIGVDGTSTAWEYLDGWARSNRTFNSTTFNAADWTYSGINATDGCTTNATCASPMPIGTSTTLPVELVSFTGTASGSSARLTWTTASETNNSGFVVERQMGDAWTDASALIAGRGTTTERHDYSFTATGLTAGRHSFRLRQIDTDGTVHYSATASVEIGVDGEGRVTLLGSRAVRIETNASQGVTVSVYDVLGRSVSSQAVSVDGTGVVELPSLASGAYVVRVVGERFAETRTLVVR